nr:MAG TPA: hypothetical protein [Crassvirales sp.]
MYNVLKLLFNTTNFAELSATVLDNFKISLSC